MKPLTTLDAFQAVDEVLMSFRHGAVDAETAMADIGSIVDQYDKENG